MDIDGWRGYSRLVEWDFHAFLCIADSNEFARVCIVITFTASNRCEVQLNDLNWHLLFTKHMSQHCTGSTITR